MGIIPVFHAYTDPEDRGLRKPHSGGESSMVRHLQAVVEKLQQRVARLDREERERERERERLVAALILAAGGHIAVSRELLLNIEGHTVVMQPDPARDLLHYSCKPPVARPLEETE